MIVSPPCRKEGPPTRGAIVRLSRGSMFSQEGLTILLLYCLACLHSFLLLLLAELLLGQPLLSILSFACLALLHLRIFTAVRHVHTITIRVCTVSFSIVIVIISIIILSLS
jgi:hypothetical protein